MVGKTDALLAVCALMLLACAACGQETLDAYQQQITAIASTARSAVVSIEDLRALAGDKDRQEIATFVQKATDQQIRDKTEQLNQLKKALGDAKAEDKRAAIRAQIAQTEMMLSYLRQTLPIRLRQVSLISTAPKSGSGFHIGDGFIVTSADVVEGMQLPVVEAADGRRATARVVAVDPDLNVGVLHANAAVVTASLAWADSASVAPGNVTVSVGNQHGEVGTVSVGLIAGVRSTGTFAGSRFYPQVLEFVGAMGPGASGAPLVNTRSEVVGMVVAVPTVRQLTTVTVSTGSSAGSRVMQQRSTEQGSDPTELILRGANALDPMVMSSGLAVPSNHLRAVINDLRAGKVVPRSWLGIAPEEQVNVHEKDGWVTVQRRIVVAGVFRSSPAARAHLQPGDVLTHINGKPVDGSLGLRTLLVGLRVGDHARLTIERKGGILTSDLTVDRRPDEIPPLVMVPH